jgi:hypothetical protein
MSDIDPVWVSPFICQYQMADTDCCEESIINANRSGRWNRSQTTGGMDLYSRDSDQLHFSADAPQIEHENIIMFAQDCLEHYIAERKNAGAQPYFAMPEGYSILRYKPGEAYHAAHSDAGWPNLAHRHLTFGMFLNTVKKGGELEFVQQELKVKPVEGRGVLFPAAWTHTHKSLPCDVDRYVFNIFYGFMKDPNAVQ